MSKVKEYTAVPPQPEWSQPSQEWLDLVEAQQSKDPDEIARATRAYNLAVNKRATRTQEVASPSRRHTPARRPSRRHTAEVNVDSPFAWS